MRDCLWLCCNVLYEKARCRPCCWWQTPACGEEEEMGEEDGLLLVLGFLVRWRLKFDEN